MNISNREKRILTGGIIFLAAFFIYTLLISPVFEKRVMLQRQLTEKQAGIAEMQSLFRQYQSVSSNFHSRALAISRRAKDFSLFSFLDTLARQSGVKENVDYMKPSSKKDENSGFMVATVKVKLKEVYLKQLVDFLSKIESSPNGVTITSLSLTKAGKNKNMLDAVLETQTLMQNEGALQ